VPAGFEQMLSGDNLTTYAAAPVYSDLLRRSFDRFVPDSGGFDLVFGFAFFVEVAPVDVVYDRDGEVLHLQASKGFSTEALRMAVRQEQN